MRTELKAFDFSAYLDNDEVIAEYLIAALEDPNPDVFFSAVGHGAKARGMTAIAERTGLGRESLYKAFAPGAKPRYDTVLKVLQSLGVKLRVTAYVADKKPPALLTLQTNCLRLLLRHLVLERRRT
jgi:probable addiction module antidote protein